jgi:hypothetical protein
MTAEGGVMTTGCAITTTASSTKTLIKNSLVLIIKNKNINSVQI